MNADTPSETPLSEKVAASLSWDFRQLNVIVKHNNNKKKEIGKSFVSIFAELHIGPKFVSPGSFKCRVLETFPGTLPPLPTRV